MTSANAVARSTRNRWAAKWNVAISASRKVTRNVSTVIDVEYEYGGQRFTTRLPYDPGERIRVRVRCGRPVGQPWNGLCRRNATAIGIRHLAASGRAGQSRATFPCCDTRSPLGCTERPPAWRCRRPHAMRTAGASRSRITLRCTEGVSLERHDLVEASSRSSAATSTRDLRGNAQQQGTHSAPLRVMTKDGKVMDFQDRAASGAVL